MKTIQFTEENVKAYLDECIKIWAKRAKPAVKDKIDSTIVVSNLNMLQAMRHAFFGETLKLEANELFASLYMSIGSRVIKRINQLDEKIKEDEEL